MSNRRYKARPSKFPFSYGMPVASHKIVRREGGTGQMGLKYDFETNKEGHELRLKKSVETLQFQMGGEEKLDAIIGFLSR